LRARRGAAALLAAAALLPARALRAEPPALLRGMTLSAWSAEEYADPALDAQLAELRAGGVEWVALIADWFQAERDSIRIAPDPARSPSDESLRRAFRRARAAGLRVLLKPQLDLHGEGWRGEIAFSKEADWRAWLASYRAFLLHYADLAREEGAEILCIGVELDATRHREADWRALAAAARERFPGRLTFAANWGREDDIRFWDALDYVGVDAYFPLADEPGRSSTELARGWAPHRKRLARLAARSRKPVLLTEIGFRSVPRAAVEPWEWQRQEPPDLEAQARLYRATLDALGKEPWLAGIFWWHWRVRPPADPAADTDYTPQGKPAWEALRRFYRGEP
jgi:hypothetical protein